MYRSLLLILFVTIINVGWAKPIENTLTIEYYQGKLESKQQPIQAVFTSVNHTFNLGISEPIVWLKITTTNNTDKKQSLTLFNHFAYLSEQATLYDSRDLTISIANFNTHSVSNNKNFIANIWLHTIELEGNQSRVFYLRNHSIYSQIYKFSLHRTNAIAKQLATHNVLAVSIIAVLLTLAFYNLALYIYGKSKVFLFYFLYLLNGAIGLAYLYGLFFQFSESHRHWLNWLNLTAIMVPAFLVFYTKYTLEVKKHSFAANNLLTTVVIVCLLNLSIAFILGIGVGMKLVPISFLFSFVVMIIVARKMILKNHPLVRIFIVAYLIYIFGMGLTIAGLYGLLPYQEYQFYASGIGLIIEGVLFSYLLHHRSKLLQLEVTRQTQLQQELRYIAEHDELTQVATRRAFEQISESLLQQSKLKHEKFSLLFIDIDEFKQVNDNYGHQVGDRVLQHVAKAIQNSIRHSDIVARIGGDEFVVLMPDIYDESALHKVSKAVIKQIQQTSLGLDMQVNISCSIGIAIYPDHGDTIKQLIIKADKALYKVKQNGKNNCAIFI
ncbi:MAG: GGDEF domain-containing protein [Colwellia sp.]|nr:GGDEF domain-containing protein [Colwellia sp.]